MALQKTVIQSGTGSEEAIAVANYFIAKSLDQPGIPSGVSNKKLQKLLYYAQAWSLAFRDTEIFPDKIEAWVHGPAIKSMYVMLKDNGFSNVIEQLPSTGTFQLSDDDKMLLDSVWDVYGKYDAQYLELLTHEELPWQEARGNLGESESSSNEISKSTMMSFYAEKIQK